MFREPNWELAPFSRLSNIPNRYLQVSGKVKKGLRVFRLVDLSIVKPSTEEHKKKHAETTGKLKAHTGLTWKLGVVERKRAQE
jgi:hypothetical protein